VVVLVALSLSACTGHSATESARVEPLPTTGRVDYQLGGAWTPPDDVTVVVRDSTDPALPGVYSICYLNAFQTQPQQADFWKDNHPDLLLTDGGEPLTDPGWPDEMALDTSTSAKRAHLASIIGEWIRGCHDDGFQAVEFDNLDSYSRFEGLEQDDNVALATALVDQAHALGLAAGQKNTADLGSRGRDEIGFDFVISEECFEYDECSAFASVYGDQFIDVEYLEGSPSDPALCSAPDVPLLTIVRDRELLPGDDPDSVFWSCRI
jgi:hypothetical protein